MGAHLGNNSSPSHASRSVPCVLFVPFNEIKRNGARDRSKATTKPKVNFYQICLPLFWPSNVVMQ